MISDRVDINRLLVEMRSIKSQTQAFGSVDQSPSAVKNLSIEKSSEANFSDLFENAVDKVNNLQRTSKELATAYEQGQSGVDVTDVMIASQKASVSFQAMLQVRNKLVEAYRDVMNMPV